MGLGNRHNVSVIWTMARGMATMGMERMVSRNVDLFCGSSLWLYAREKQGDYSRIGVAQRDELFTHFRSNGSMTFLEICKNVEIQQCFVPGFQR